MHHYLNIATKAARSAGKMIIRYLDGGNELTDVNPAVEQEILSIIRQAYPTHATLGKETGHVDGTECTWIIDPINGNTNFIHGYPQFAVSIAIGIKNQIEHGVIYNPISQELFIASRGAGAQLNGRRLRAVTHTPLSSALIAMTFPTLCPEIQRTLSFKISETIALKCKETLRTGSSALDLAYLAANRLDGFWGVGLKSWEVAAGMLLVREAGSFVEDYAQGSLIAGTRKTYAGLSHILQELGLGQSAHPSF